MITNLDASASVFIGETPALITDYELSAGKSVTLDSKERIDGITASGTVAITFIESFLD